MKIDKEFFNENGYCIVKEVFSAEEILKFRNLTYTTLENDKLNNNVIKVITDIKNVYYPTGDLLSKPLSELLLSDKILNIAGTILNSKPTYFGDSTYQIGIGDRGFHRDNIDRIPFQGDDWEGEYDIIRIGIYMQDHDLYSGGLKVVSGSHLGKNKKRVFVNSKAGDVVVWSLKTLHSGNAVRLKALPDLVMGYRLENLLPKFLITDSQKERISCFMSFAKEGECLERYIQKYMKVKMTEHIKGSDYSDAIQKTQNKNLIIKKIEIV